ncbi:MAG: HDOD domain-containing protein [Oscillospiraceae bacterium]|nr:HDOD domain-containing protein [Oscillospiraceae bacterium]
MDLMVVPKPIFNKYKDVIGYYLAYQVGNALSNVGMSALLEHSTDSPFFEFINDIGIKTLTGGKMLFVPVTNVLLATSIEQTCEVDPSLIVLLLGGKIDLNEANLQSVARLKQHGFKIAFRHYKDINALKPFLPHIDFIICGNETGTVMSAIAEVRASNFPIKIIASEVDTISIFQRITSFGVELCRGDFYRETTKVSEDNPVSPLKINCLQLMNQVSQDDFDLAKFSKTVQRDTSLALQFLRMVNSSHVRANKITSLKHAAAMLGQNEIRKWVTTAATTTMGQETPGEIVRLSMLRAKFCENLAKHFEMAIHMDNLFLMGLFSVLDVILDMTMEKALHLVSVPEQIALALMGGDNEFSKVYSFAQSYENADWTDVSRIALIDDISISDIAAAYHDALMWYGKMINMTMDEDEIDTDVT